jgi:predicted GNAT family acetyltransferase
VNADQYNWQKVKEKDIPHVENMLRNIENDYTIACGRFLIRQTDSKRFGKMENDYIWKLSDKKGSLCGLLINSRSTLIPVLCGIKEIPCLKFLKGFIHKKNIHSVKGLKEEVLVIEKEIVKTGKVIADIYDYDLMTLDTLPLLKNNLNSSINLVLRVPHLKDLDTMAQLQAAYEQEEVIPKGSTFNAAASRINIANIIADGKILAAEINGQLVGKINVSGISFTRYLVGGVYVHPDFRGLGIARYMAKEFITSLINEGRGVTLFLKKNNLPARRLYLGLGFKVRGDYRITYY